MPEDLKRLEAPTPQLKKHAQTSDSRPSTAGKQSMAGASQQPDIDWNDLFPSQSLSVNT